MSRLLDLYPRAWRERYLEEFGDLLAQRPPTHRDRVDIARGAMDAWLHPQDVGRVPAQPDRGDRARSMSAAVAAILGGGMWIVGGASMNATQVDPSLGYKESPTAVLVLVGGMLLTALAARGLSAAATGSAAGGRTTLAMLIGAALTAMPWPILIVGFYGYTVSVAAYGVFMARHGHVLVGGVLSLAALVLTSFNTEDERALLAIPLGLAWIAVGVSALRRSPVAAVA